MFKKFKGVCWFTLICIQLQNVFGWFLILPSKATICVDYVNRILFWPPRIYVVSKCLKIWLNRSVFQSTIYLLSSVFIAQFRIITKMLHRIWKHLTGLTFVHAFLKQIPSHWKKFCIFSKMFFQIIVFSLGKIYYKH